MTSAIIGILSGLLVIGTIALLKKLDKTIIYGLILSAIGFLYVGFTWMNWQALVINCIQAVFFLFLAYFGMKQDIRILIAGYFLHGSWDLLYNLFPSVNLIPPHYDMFCLSIDFTMGFYLLMIRQKLKTCN